MLLRTLAGSRAGQIEDYTYEAGRRAMAAGFAERLQEAPALPPRKTAEAETPTTKTEEHASPVLRGRRRSGRKA